MTLCLKVFGLKPRSAFIRFLKKLSKPDNPEKLLEDCQVSKWTLTATSLDVELIVKTDRKKKRKPTAGNQQPPEGWEKFILLVTQFPSNVDPELSGLSVCCAQCVLLFHQPLIAGGAANGQRLRLHIPRVEENGQHMQLDDVSQG